MRIVICYRKGYVTTRNDYNISYKPTGLVDFSRFPCYRYGIVFSKLSRALRYITYTVTSFIFERISNIIKMAINTRKCIEIRKYSQYLILFITYEMVMVF